MATNGSGATALAGTRIGVDAFSSEAADPGDGGRTVLGRIAAIMDAFDEGQQVLSLRELSEQVRLPKSTVHRLAEQLRALGWLQRDHNTGYRIGMRLFELGGLALQRNQLRDVAYPHLSALTAKTGLSVQLAVLDRGDVVYLERIVVGDYWLPTRLGGRMPSYCTGLGKAMLAFDAAAAEGVMATRLPRRTDQTITEPDALRDELAQVRSSGIAFDRSEAFDGLGCVAAPIRNSGRAIGAVSVTGPVDRMEWAATANAVKRTAASIWDARFGTMRTANANEGRHRYGANPLRLAPAGAASA